MRDRAAIADEDPGAGKVGAANDEEVGGEAGPDGVEGGVEVWGEGCTFGGGGGGASSDVAPRPVAEASRNRMASEAGIDGGPRWLQLAGWKLDTVCNAAPGRGARMSRLVPNF